MPKILLLLVFWGLLAAAPVRAEDMSLYDAEISVDVTSENASVAREKAMSEANRQALMLVAGRLTTKEGASVLNHLNDNQVLNFIKEVTVESEKVSDVRYLAQLKISINGDILKAYLSEKNAPFAMVEETSVIIIPTFREFITDSPLLWEDHNPWRRAWTDNPLTSGPIKIAALDASAAGRITAAQALQMNGIILDQIAAENHSDEIYIADAVYDGIDGIDVTLSSYKDGSQQNIKVPGMRSPLLFADAVQKTKEALIAKLQQQSRTVSQTRDEITVLYDFRRLSDWVNTQRLLKGTAGVNDVVINALGGGRVQFKLMFTGGLERLLRNLRDKNLNLKPYDSFYTLEHY